MLKVDMSPKQARAVVTLLQGVLSSAEKVPSYDALEELVLACRALRMAEELPKGVSAPPLMQGMGVAERGVKLSAFPVSGAAEPQKRPN